MKTITVQASGSYDVIIGKGLLAKSGEYLRQVSKAETVVLVSDDNVFPLYGERTVNALEAAGYKVLTFVFPHGEQNKNLAVYGQLLETMCEAHVTRGDIVAALGGGVVGDLAGFAAATYQRGIPFIQLPTTLLAAVDSSVGGKTAVDLSAGKNQVGAFHQPSLVLCDIETLDTLPEEQYRCGCAEVIKTAMISSRDFFDSLAKTPVKAQYEEVIGTCVQLKAEVVRQDEFDTGVRMMLNFGHTFGHAAESCSGFGILHGQGVAMGMAAITRAAVKKGICGEEVLTDLLSMLAAYQLPADMQYPVEAVLTAVLSDKKNRGRIISLIVPEAVGRCRIEKVETADLKGWAEAGDIG